MKQLELLHKINELFSIFVTQIKGASSINLYDINIISEDILIPLFKEVFQLSNLRNVNNDNKNYPGIDLADDNNRVAFQVTSTTNSGKINDAFHQFFKHELIQKYDRLYFYILTEKQSSYTIRNESLEKSGFDFSPSRDILDYRNIIQKIKGLDIQRIEIVRSILEKQFDVGKKLSSISSTDASEKSKDLWRIKSENSETIYSNLLEITFPEKLYIASLDTDRKEVLKASRVEGGAFLKNSATTRQVVWEALSQKGLRFANDWTCHENKIITFHDLNDDIIPLHELIDEGTVEKFGPDEFYQIDRNHENVFKGLLHFCLQRFLYQKKIEWKHEDRLFVFMPEYGELQKRQISWHGKVNATRTVFDVKINNKTGEISYCKHLAFKTFYRLYEDKWYIEIIPEWYITFNGYKKSYYGSEKIKWLKRNERNQHVFNHLKFVVHFLKQVEQPSPFDDNRQYFPGFLKYEQIVKSVGHPQINDDDWNKDEGKENQKRLNDPQQELPLKF